MQRNIQNYEVMMHERGLPNVLATYLEDVVNKHGTAIFAACMANQQDGRLFGNMTSNDLANPGKKVKSSLSDFFPEQKQTTEDGKDKIIQVDILGKQISNAVNEDLRSGVNMEAVGGLIAQSLNKYPRFQAVLEKIAAENPAYNKSAYQDFILGQLVYFSLLPVIESTIKDIKEKEYDPSESRQRQYRTDLKVEQEKPKPDKKIVKNLAEKLNAEKAIQEPAAIKMKSYTGQMNKMKEMFAKAKAYNHEHALKTLTSYEVTGPQQPNAVEMLNSAVTAKPVNVEDQIAEAERRIREASASLSRADSDATSPQKSATDSVVPSSRATQMTSEGPKRAMTDPAPPKSEVSRKDEQAQWDRLRSNTEKRAPIQALKEKAEADKHHERAKKEGAAGEVPDDLFKEEQRRGPGVK